MRKRLARPTPKLMSSQGDNGALAAPDPHCSVHWPLSPRPHGLSGRRAHGLPRSPVHLAMLRPSVCVLCRLGAHGSVVPEATWPSASWAPQAGTRKDPEMHSSREQAKPPGRGLRPLSSHLQAPEDRPLKWGRNSGHWLLSYLC